MPSLWDTGIAKDKIVIGVDGCRRTCAKPPNFPWLDHLQRIAAPEHWTAVLNRNVGGPDRGAGCATAASLRQQNRSPNAEQAHGNQTETGVYMALHRCSLLQLCFSRILDEDPLMLDDCVSRCSDKALTMAARRVEAFVNPTQWPTTAPFLSI